ncbi:hypothetical protein [Dyadobacter crusticola]|uniref:hypothetical protein n=1 Tax=Dyadobacter crusticola TaxID=292407 RepID=UPI0004E18420|nr:hypothetical protein [Dyadobacter crusticola]
MKKILFAAAVLVLGFSSANAQYGPHYDTRGDYHNSQRNGRGSDINHLQREVRQQIAMGVERGTLSSREANALMVQYERIEAREQRFSHRGRLSPREARIIREDLQRLMADTRRMSSRRGDHWARERRQRY